MKTRFGISVGLTGAAIFLSGLFGGYLLTFVLAGYVLLFEENMWLKKTAIKACVLMIMFSLLNAFVGLVPSTMSFINNICNLFDGSFNSKVVQDIVEIIQRGLSIIETIVFIVLGIKAMGQGTIAIPVVDNLINKHFQNH